MSYSSKFETLEPRRLFAAPSAALPFGLTDSTFGTAGHVSVAGNTSSSVAQLVVAADGSVYEVGFNSIACFSFSGKLDKTFGDDGVAQVVGGNFVDAAVDSSNRLYLLVKNDLGSDQTILVRYTADGQVDGTYATGGSTTVVTDDEFSPVALALQSDGKIVIAGTEDNSNGDTSMRLLRVGTDGTLDNTFSSGGSFQAHLGTSTSLTPIIFDKVVGIRILAGGDILVGGGTLSYASTNSSANPAISGSDIVLAHVTSSGTFDTSFGSGGIVRHSFESQATVKYNDPDFDAVLPDAFDSRADGSTVLVENYYLSDNFDVAAFAPDGSQTFRKAVPYDPIVEDVNNVIQIKALADGRAVLFSQSSNSRTGFALTPIGADGTPGPAVLTDDLNSATTDITSGVPGAIAIASNGQILVGGADQNYSRLVLQQLNASTADAPRPDDFANGTVSSIVVSDDGYVHLAYYNSADRDLMYVRRLRNGLWGKPITIDAKPGAGTSLSIGVDAQNNPFIAYYDRKSKTLKLATSADEGVHFSTRVLDQSADVGQYVSAASSTGPASAGGVGAAIAYYDKTHGDLKVAAQNAKGIWSISTVDSKDDVGQNAAIQYSGTRLQIVYFDKTAGIVKFAGQDSKGVVQFKTVGRATGGVESLSIGSSTDDQPAVVYHDLASGDLRLSVYTAGPKFVSHTIATHTGQATAATDSLGFNDVTLYTYSKSTNKLLEIADPLHSRVDTAAFSGGANLSVAENLLSLFTTLASFNDPTTGDLEVRAILTS